ncbi:hypothetical protein SpCBS45565_g03357 [Spizellomyces sp. 'palustris']|nr:hypothetical protein SpCBS45565_g03357 [Spizellomyces sp. 'palustris']
MAEEPKPPSSDSFDAAPSLERYATPRRPLLPKLGRTSRQRKIYICLFVTSVSLAIFLPILFLVIVPKIAQANINGSKLTLSSAAIAKATTSSFALSSQGFVEDAGSIDATISFVNGTVDVTWTGSGTNGTDVPLARIFGMPDLVVKGAKGDLAIKDANVEIVDTAAMTKFARFMMLGADFEWRLSGNAQAKAFGMTIKGLTMDKTVKMKALNGLRNISITSFDLPRNDPAGGIQIVTITLMDNPSPMTIELGTIEFSVAFEGATVGTLSAQNVTLVPGANSLPLSGRLLTGTTPAALKALSQMFTSYIAGQPANITVTGTNVVPPSGAADWLAKGFQGIPLSVSLVPPVPQKLISDIKLGDMDVAFSPNDPSGLSAAVSVASLTATFKSPLAFPLKINQVQQRITITSASTKEDIATLEAPTAEADGDSTKGTLSTKVVGGTLKAIPGKNAQFAEFMKGLLTGDTVPFPLKGTSTVQAATAAGVVTISSVPIVDSPTVKGMNSLRDIRINSVAIKGGSQAGIQLEIGTILANPSQLSLSGLGEITFDMVFQNQRVGTVSLPDTGIKRGENAITATALFNPAPDSADALAAGKVMLTNFLGGRTSTININGTPQSGRIGSLAPALATLSIPTTLNGIPPTLIQSTTLSLNGVLGTIISQTASVTIALTNPFDAPFTLVSLDSTIKSNGQSIAAIQSQTVTPAFTLQGKTSGSTPKIDLKLQINGAAISGLFQAVGGNLLVDVTAEMRVRVGSYETSIAYAQSGVRTSLGSLF